MLPSESEYSYRAPKTAFRQEAQRLFDGHMARDLEHSSVYDPVKHNQYPRLIETKPSRFAISAVLLDRLGDKIFVGEANETLLPHLARLRNRLDKLYAGNLDDYLEQLALDCCAVDISSEINEVLNDPENNDLINAYETILLDVVTDPNAVDNDSFFASGSVHEVLQSRLNIPHSSEILTSGVALVRWGLELMPDASLKSAGQKRAFILHLIPFFEKMSHLESAYADKYFFGKWYGGYMDTREAGVALARDANDGPTLRLTDHVERPKKTYGQPVGCPASFTFESLATAGLSLAAKPKMSVTERMLTAFVNEAYDRGLLN